MATTLLTPDSAGKCGQQASLGSPCTDGCDSNYCSCPSDVDFNKTVEGPNFQPTQAEIDQMNSQCKAADPYSLSRPWPGPYYEEVLPLDPDGNPVSSPFECDAKWELIGGQWKSTKSACFKCLPPPPY
jgi:hypothetical protein